MCVSSWHCHSMKSLSRVTPLVRMNMSSGGSSRVYVWLSIVSAVIVSGFGYLQAEAAGFVVDCSGGESGSSAVVDDTDPSTSDFAVGSGDVSRVGVVEWPCLSWLDRIFCDILVGENGPLDDRVGVVYSSTVALIELAISALDVYGKQMLSTALMLVLTTTMVG